MFRTLAVVLALETLFLCAPSVAQSERTLSTLATFTSEVGLYDPLGNIVLGPNGEIFGLAGAGGTSGNGGIFRLTPPAEEGGTWTNNIMYAFGGGDDGRHPVVLIPGKHGVLYGATSAGGGGPCTGGGGGCGTVFSLTPPATLGGNWTEKVLYAFGAAIADDGIGPVGLTLDSDGTLYGATEEGGIGGHGTVFRLNPNSEGDRWTEDVLYRFRGTANEDGSGPAGVTIANGVLYGTTAEGGPKNQGTVYQLAPGPALPWKETILYSFQSNPGSVATPNTPVLAGPGGVLFGTASSGSGGTCISAGEQCGAVYQLSPPTGKGAPWTLTIPHYFGGDVKSQPTGLVMAGDGSLYGVTRQGGASRLGTVFKLTPTVPGGDWTYSLIYEFSDCPNCSPNGPVAINATGGLYGVTNTADGSGQVYELLPQSSTSN